MSTTADIARLALSRAGLLDQADAAVQAATTDVRLMWECSATLEPQNPVLIKLGRAMALDDAALDRLFATAASL